MINQAIRPEAPPRNVLAMAWGANAWLPELKPNQPKNKMPVPSNTNGRLCGGNGDFGHPARLPSTSEMASAAAPALTWITVPPAVS